MDIVPQVSRISRMMIYTTNLNSLTNIIIGLFCNLCTHNQSNNYFRMKNRIAFVDYIRVQINWSQRKRLAVGASCFVVGAAFSAWSFWWKAVPGVTMDTLEQ